jgi:hypothetical protein
MMDRFPTPGMSWLGGKVLGLLLLWLQIAGLLKPKQEGLRLIAQ